MEYKIFLIIAPGLEALALRELQEKCPLPNTLVTKGGIEVMGNLDWIVRAHTILKIPTRMLLRLEEFKVKDFPKLHQKFLNLKWNTFLSHPEPEFEISCTRSRLMHTGRIEETIKKALTEALVRQPLNRDWEKKKYPPQTFYIRLVEDVLTLSVDLSGEPLYKRGLQIIKGEAPIRENLASAFLYELTAGLKSSYPLVDPMCGSGTFLTEAENFHRPLHKRPFAFETFPFFKGKLVRAGEESSPLPISGVKGFDLNEELIKKVRDASGLDLNVLDSAKDKLPMHQDFIMICNPPYGERIKIENKRGSFLKGAWEKFMTVDRPFRFAWVLPSDMDDLFSVPKNYKLLTKLPLRNGGMRVTYWVWERI